jgi:hypothetical protein
MASALSNFPMIRRAGRITLVGGLLVAAFVMVALLLARCCSVSNTRKIRDAKNWILLAAAILGLYAVVMQFSRNRVAGGPVRVGAAGVVLALLAYSTLEDMRAVDTTMFGAYDVNTVQMILLLILVAPLIVRMFGLRMPDVAPAGMVTGYRA